MLGYLFKLNCFFFLVIICKFSKFTKESTREGLLTLLKLCWKILFFFLFLFLIICWKVHWSIYIIRQHLYMLRQCIKQEVQCSLMMPKSSPVRCKILALDSRCLQERTTQKHLQGAPVWSRPNTLRRLSQEIFLQL